MFAIALARYSANLSTSVTLDVLFSLQFSLDQISVNDTRVSLTQQKTLFG